MLLCPADKYIWGCTINFWLMFVECIFWDKYGFNFKWKWNLYMKHSLGQKRTKTYIYKEKFANRAIFYFLRLLIIGRQDFVTKNEMTFCNLNFAIEFVNFTMYILIRCALGLGYVFALCGWAHHDSVQSTGLSPKEPGFSSYEHPWES